MAIAYVVKTYGMSRNFVNVTHAVRMNARPSASKLSLLSFTQDMVWDVQVYIHNSLNTLQWYNIMLYSFSAPDEVDPIFGFYLMNPGADYPPPIRGIGGIHVIDCVLMQCNFHSAKMPCWKFRQWAYIWTPKNPARVTARTIIISLQN